MASSKRGLGQGGKLGGADDLAAGPEMIVEAGRGAPSRGRSGGPAMAARAGAARPAAKTGKAGKAKQAASKGARKR